MKEYFREKIQVHSDGEISDWQEAKNLVHEKLGYGAQFKLDTEQGDFEVL